MNDGAFARVRDIDTTLRGLLPVSTHALRRYYTDCLKDADTRVVQTLLGHDLEKLGTLGPYFPVEASWQQRCDAYTTFIGPLT